MIVLKQSKLSKNGLSISSHPGCVRISLHPRLKEVERELILSQTHLDDPLGIGNLVVGVLLVLLPSEEVGGILTVRITRGFGR